MGAYTKIIVSPGVLSVVRYELIERNPLPQEATGLIAVVNRQLAHMASLLDDLLDVARITKGKIELNKEMLDVRHVVTAAAEAV